MATTGLPSDTDADIARVSEALAMITPRWHVRILLALGRPLRYSEVADKLAWLQNGQLHPRLQSLCEAGLVQRTEHTPRHVTYGHTDRGAALLPVLPLIVTWAEEHLEKADRPLPAIEQIEDSLTLLTRRHAAAILWVLKSRGQTGGRTLAKMVMPDSDWTNVYPPLRQLVADGLVDTAGIGKPYRLSDAATLSGLSSALCPRGRPGSPSPRLPGTRSGDARTPRLLRRRGSATSRGYQPQPPRPHPARTARSPH